MSIDTSLSQTIHESSRVARSPKHELPIATNKDKFVSNAIKLSLDNSYFIFTRKDRHLKIIGICNKNIN